MKTHSAPSDPLHGPSVSIITITLNAASTLPRTLASVAAQDYPFIEYIIIDGASSDSTLSLVSQYASTVSFCLSCPDNGLYHAMNRGLQLASGDYVWFLNSGDELNSPTTVSSMFQSSAESDSPADVYYGDTLITAPDGSIIGPRRLSPPDHLSYDSFRHGMLVCHQAFVPRRSLCPLYDTRYSLSADFDWCIRILQSASSVVNTNQTLVRYLDGGLTKHHLRRSLSERFSIMSHHYGFLPTLLRHIPIAFRFFFFWLTRGRF